MARIILKSPYIKPGAKEHLANYVEYIATRSGVEKMNDSKRFLPATQKQGAAIKKLLARFPDSRELYENEDYKISPNRENATQLILRIAETHPELFESKSRYIDYIANRPHAQQQESGHGLFTDRGVPVVISKVRQELANYPGNVWTHIVSLKREDAARLGFDHGAAWQTLLQSQRNAIARAMRIDPSHFRWYAAFHDADHHPHVHMIAWSTHPKEAYLSKKGLAEIKSSLAKEIFRQDLMQIYEEETRQRDALRNDSREKIRELVAQINNGGCNNPALETMLTELAEKLSRTSGKKVYGYLSPAIKERVNAIVDELERDERISTLYGLWDEQRREVFRTYRDSVPERPPLSQNKEFKSIRNAVITEALKLRQQERTEEEPNPIPPDSPEPEVSQENESMWTKAYMEARKCLYGDGQTPPNPTQAFQLMGEEAEKRNPLAMHDLGNMLLRGMGCDKDEALAQEWFAKALAGFLSAEKLAKKKGYLWYRIGKMYAMGYGTEQDYSAAASWYEKAVKEDNPFAAYALGSLTLRGEGVEQDEKQALRLFHQAAEHEKKPNAYAMYELGKMYAKGSGTVIDGAASRRWYEKAYLAFQQIEVTAPEDKLQYRLGYMALHGIGTEESRETAARYFEKSAALKNKDALYAAGKLFSDKSFSGFDIQKAIAYLETAVNDASNSNAAYLLGKLYAKGELLPKDMEKALPYLFLAANAQNPFALCLLGKIYCYGDGVLKDTAFGLELLSCAAALGNDYARQLADRILHPQAGNAFSAVLTLLRQTSQIFQNELNCRRDIPRPGLDRKLRRRLQEKMEAHGQRMAFR